MYLNFYISLRIQFVFHRGYNSDMENPQGGVRGRGTMRGRGGRGGRGSRNDSRFNAGKEY